MLDVLSVAMVVAFFAVAAAFVAGCDRIIGADPGLEEEPVAELPLPADTSCAGAEPAGGKAPAAV
ncbi:MAG TPA: hypothetical protein VFW71_03535 [Actinomycetota bacterium]|nr:hypothetical protein [Actinomycetota bacterium]